MRADRTDEELKKIARDLITNQIFLSTQIKNQSDIGMVFMVLAFADQKLIEEYKKDDVVAFFEYYSKAGPRSINGYPTFFSAHSLTRTEYEKVVDLARQATTALETTLGKPT